MTTESSLSTTLSQVIPLETLNLNLTNEVDNKVKTIGKNLFKSSLGNSSSSQFTSSRDNVKQKIIANRRQLVLLASAYLSNRAAQTTRFSISKTEKGTTYSRRFSIRQSNGSSSNSIHRIYSSKMKVLQQTNIHSLPPLTSRSQLLASLASRKSVKVTTNLLNHWERSSYLPALHHVYRGHKRSLTELTENTGSSQHLSPKHHRSYSAGCQFYDLSKALPLDRPLRKNSDPDPSQLPLPPQPPTRKKEETLIRNILSSSSQKNKTDLKFSIKIPRIKKKNWISSLFSKEVKNLKELKIDEKKKEVVLPEELLDPEKFAKLIEFVVLLKFTHPNFYSKFSKKEKTFLELLLATDTSCLFGNKSILVVSQEYLGQLNPTEVQKIIRKVQGLKVDDKSPLPIQQYGLFQKFPILQNQEVLGRFLKDIGTAQHLYPGLYLKFTSNQKKLTAIFLQSFQLHRILGTSFPHAFSLVLKVYQSNFLIPKSENSLFEGLAALIQNTVKCMIPKIRPGESIDRFLSLLSWISNPALLKEWILQISQKDGNFLFKIKVLRDLNGVLRAWNSNPDLNGSELIKTRLSYRSLKDHFLIMNDQEISMFLFEIIDHRSTLITSCAICRDANRFNALIEKAKAFQQKNTNQNINFLIQELLRIGKVLEENKSIKFQDVLRVFLTDWKFVNHFGSHNMKFNQEELIRGISLLEGEK